MTRLIPLAILLLPLLEIAGFILVSRWIGLPGVLLAVIAGAVGGLLLLQRTGLNTVTRLRQALSEGKEPGRSLIDGACFAAAGLLFIVPGFVSDLAAFALVLPWIRHYLLRRMASKFEIRTHGFDRTANLHETIIETDFTEVEPDSADSGDRRPEPPQTEPPLIDLSPDSKS